MVVVLSLLDVSSVRISNNTNGSESLSSSALSVGLGVKVADVEVGVSVLADDDTVGDLVRTEPLRGRTSAATVVDGFDAVFVVSGAGATILSALLVSFGLFIVTSMGGGVLLDARAEFLFEIGAEVGIGVLDVVEAGVETVVWLGAWGLVEMGTDEFWAFMVLVEVCIVFMCLCMCVCVFVRSYCTHVAIGQVFPFLFL